MHTRSHAFGRSSLVDGCVNNVLLQTVRHQQGAAAVAQ